MATNYMANYASKMTNGQAATPLMSAPAQTAPVSSGGGPIAAATNAAKSVSLGTPAAAPLAPAGGTSGALTTALGKAKKVAAPLAPLGTGTNQTLGGTGAPLNNNAGYNIIQPGQLTAQPGGVNGLNQITNQPGTTGRVGPTIQNAPIGNQTDMFDPGSYGGFDPAAQEKAYFDQQIAGYNGQQQAALQAMQQGVGTNQQYLQEQLAALAAQQAVDSDSAQQLQNRRGGFYSGGLDYQLGTIGSQYAGQRGNLMRDVATRNQALIDQYGTQANTIAQQINSLTQAQPDILRQRVYDWIDRERNYGTNYANTFGQLNGQDTMAMNQQRFNQRDTDRKFNVDTAFGLTDRSGQLVSPQTDTKGLWRQLDTGINSNTDPLLQSMEGQTTDSNLVTAQQERDLAPRATALQEWSQAGYATPNVAAILGVPVGTPTNDASYRQASLALDQDKLKLDQMQMVAQAQNQQTQQAKPISATTAGNMLAQALQKQIGVNENGKAVYGTYTDPGTREQAFVDLFNNYGVSGNDMISSLSKAGYSMNEINSLKNKYPEVFQ